MFQFFKTYAFVTYYLPIFVILMGLQFFFLLIIYGSNYGRHLKINSKICLIPAHINQFLMEFPSFIIPLLCLYYSSNKKYFSNSFPCILTFMMFTMHYFYRSLIYPFMIKGSKKQPISYTFLGNLTTAINGYMQGYYLVNWNQYSAKQFYDQNFQLGIILYVSGFIIHVHSDLIMKNFRSRKKEKEQYFVPNKGLFLYVCSPNYFGEIIEQTGYTLSTWSLNGLAFLIYTLSNLIPRAVQHHKQYHEKFGDEYPRSRKIIFPLFFQK